MQYLRPVGRGPSAHTSPGPNEEAAEQKLQGIELAPLRTHAHASGCQPPAGSTAPTWEDVAEVRPAAGAQHLYPRLRFGRR